MQVKGPLRGPPSKSKGSPGRRPCQPGCARFPFGDTAAAPGEGRDYEGGSQRPGPLP